MLICFLVKNIFIFFISFELILIPLSIHIILQGSRFDKISATKYLIIYTLVGSIFLWFHYFFGRNNRDIRFWRNCLACW
jgi:NADH:ubiquinone oxidoreductase subunit 4 (subunit M)